MPRSARIVSLLTGVVWLTLIVHVCTLLTSGGGPTVGAQPVRQLTRVGDPTIAPVVSVKAAPGCSAPTKTLVVDRVVPVIDAVI
jgi:hypothetical protein